MKIWFLASEIVPFAKTGGLADVAASLGRYLGEQGHDVRLCMPMYRAVRESGVELAPHPRLQDVPCPLGARELLFSVSTAKLPASDVEVYFVRCPELFDREGIYDTAQDEHLRFALFARASLQICQWLQWAPEVIHCNDWHAALLPLYLKVHFAWDRLFRDTRTLLTIHNIAFQGAFPAHVVDDLGLSEMRHMLPQEDLAHGGLSFLRTGLMHADALSTVSPTYAEEIRRPELGMGLDGLLEARKDVLSGILNGVDYAEWDPRGDARIAARYGPEDLSGKALCRRALLERFELAPGPAGPVFGMVSRLTWQKGVELVLEALPAVLEREDVRLVVLGTGEERYEQGLRALAAAFPGKVAFHRGYDEDLAHQVEAGSDAFLMPSRYEPCGLNQMYSLRYGAVPVVRRTGGLADTVEPYAPGANASGDRGTGFLFEDFQPAALAGALQQAMRLFAAPPRWRALVLRGMARDFSWQVEGARYEELYRRVAAGSPGGGL